MELELSGWRAGRGQFLVVVCKYHALPPVLTV